MSCLLQLPPSLPPGTYNSWIFSAPNLQDTLNKSGLKREPGKINSPALAASSSLRSKEVQMALAHFPLNLKGKHQNQRAATQTALGSYSLKQLEVALLKNKP